MSDTVGGQLAPGRFVTLATTVRRILDDPELLAGVLDIADVLREAMAPHAGQRLTEPLSRRDPRRRRARPGFGSTGSPRRSLRSRRPSRTPPNASCAPSSLTGRTIETSTWRSTTVTRTSTSCPGRPSSRGWRSPRSMSARSSREGVWQRRTAILTSATIPCSLPARVGLPADSTDVTDVGSPFDYPHHALLYCALHLPDPRADRYRDAVHDELVALIAAAGGRTLALFTSWKAMDLAAAAVRERVDVPILTQRDLPKPALVARFAESTRRRACSPRPGSSRVSTCPGAR